MKINIEGHIIDTSDIKMITPIEGIDLEFIDDLVGVSYTNYRFEVLLNKRHKLIIDGEIDRIIPGVNEMTEVWYFNDYENRLSLLKNQVNVLRDEIISYWNDDKKDIPYLTLK